MKSDVSLEKLKTLGIPVFMAVSPRGTGKTYFFDIIKEDLEKRNKRVLYLYSDGFTMSYVKAKIKKDKIEVILLDESEVIL